MAVRPVDKLLAGYVAFVTALILIRGPLSQPAAPWMLGLHGLFAGLLFLLIRSDSTPREPLSTHPSVAAVTHDLYPLLMLFPLYLQIGLLNEPLGVDGILVNDAVVQRWEAAIFGGQISYTWLRNAPSVFWSGVLHLAYIAYYPIILVGPILLTWRMRRKETRAVILTMMIAFVFCYLWFLLYPVAGPYYAFDRPTGPVRDVWSARLVYGLLAGGSSVGAAFPSSHVAATLSTTLALWRVWRPLGIIVTVPSALLIVGTVYCQMHYGIDATTGVVVGAGAAWAASKIDP